MVLDFGLWCTSVHLDSMELPSSSRVSSKLTKKEFARRLGRNHTEHLQGLRKALFNSAVRKGLGEEGMS